MKLERHAEILRLIHEYDIETQEELAERLQQSGFSVTQATISRDIREMKLMKTAGENGHLRYALLQTSGQDMAARYVRVLRDAFVTMDTADNLLVIKTAPGMAMAAAAVLDEMDWSEIVGSIAGDNTIMCAARSRQDALRVMDRLKKMLINS